MKKQINQGVPKAIAIILFSILIVNPGCSKNTKPLAPGKPTAGSSKIIYTDVNPDSAILKSPIDSFNLDLNNDGITDFQFDRTHVQICLDFSEGTGASGANLSVKPASGSNAIMTGVSDLARAIDRSAAIAPDSLWGTTSRVLLYGVTSGRCNNSGASVVGSWLNVSDKYLGLKFFKGNNAYYGWARLTCTYFAVSLRTLYIGRLILKDYAYNSIPNQPILAGQTK